MSGFASALIFQVVFETWPVFDTPIGHWVEGLKNWLDKIEPLTRAPSLEVEGYYSATQSDTFLEIFGRVYSGFYTLTGFLFSIVFFLLSGLCSGNFRSTSRVTGWAFWTNLIATPMLFSVYVLLEGQFDSGDVSRLWLMTTGSLVLTATPLAVAIFGLGLASVTRPNQTSPVEGER